MGARSGGTRCESPSPRLWLPPRSVAALILALCLATGAGAWRLDTDPSLLEYFAEDSDVRRSLQIVDENGGSSPLNIAVRRKDGERLDTRDSYKHMWELQRALQNDPAVGTVLSLPVLMAEANRSPIAKLLTWDWLLDILSRPEFDRVAEGFVNKQRTEALFMLRMVEGARSERRTDVVARLQGIVREARIHRLAHGRHLRAAGASRGPRGRESVRGSGGTVGRSAR